jgi:predicted secreted protein
MLMSKSDKESVDLMRLIKISLVACALLLLSACASNRESATSSSDTKPPAVTAPQGSAAPTEAKQSSSSAPPLSTISAANPNPSPAEINRKIIRNAEISVETDVPENGLRKIAAIAESKGGFIVTSEVRQQGGGGASSASKIVTVVARIPSAQFETTVEEIIKLGSRVLQEKRTGLDVTEEYIDLEARIRTKQALEAQFLEIMKQARTVSEALEVQRQIADVRTEIEQLEGRRRFLENQSSLSTITVTLQQPVSIVPTSPGGFYSSVKEAISDGFDVAVMIVLIFIRVALALLPVLVLIVLPILLLVRFLLKRYKRQREAQ